MSGTLCQCCKTQHWPAHRKHDEGQISDQVFGAHMRRISHEIYSKGKGARRADGPSGKLTLGLDASAFPRPRSAAGETVNTAFAAPQHEILVVSSGLPLGLSVRTVPDVALPRRRELTRHVILFSLVVLERLPGPPTPARLAVKTGQ